MALGSSPEPGTPVVVVFAPCSVVSVEMEIVGATAEVHCRVAGQGVQVARTARTLGGDAVLCTACGGEPGRLFRLLLAQEPGIARWVSGGMTQVAVDVLRDGSRHNLVRTSPVPLNRHATDALFRTALTAASGAGACVLTGGPAESEVPSEVYGRLAAGLRSLGVPVVADVTGEALTGAVCAGVDLVKASDRSLVAEGRATDLSRRAVVDAMHALHDSGAASVMVARDDGTVLAITDGNLLEMNGLEPHLPSPIGGEDQMTASLALSLATAEPIDMALRRAYAAGATDMTGSGPNSDPVRSVVDTLARSATVRSSPASR